MPSTSSPDEELAAIVLSDHIVHVKWVDAQTSGGSGWQDADDMMEAAKAPAPFVHTVGYLMHTDDQRIAVCDTIQEDGTAGGYVHLIPHGMVIELNTLYRDITYGED